MSRLCDEWEATRSMHGLEERLETVSRNEGSLSLKGAADTRRLGVNRILVPEKGRYYNAEVLKIPRPSKLT